MELVSQLALYCSIRRSCRVNISCVHVLREPRVFVARFHLRLPVFQYWTISVIQLSRALSLLNSGLLVKIGWLPSLSTRVRSLSTLSIKRTREPTLAVTLRARVSFTHDVCLLSGYLTEINSHMVIMIVYLKCRMSSCNKILQKAQNICVGMNLGFK